MRKIHVFFGNEMDQGWYQKHGETMCFYPCGFNIPGIACNLLNFVEVLQGGNANTRLNPLAEVFVHQQGTGSLDGERGGPISSGIDNDNDRIPNEWKTAKGPKGAQVKKKKVSWKTENRHCILNENEDDLTIKTEEANQAINTLIYTICK